MILREMNNWEIEDREIALNSLKEVHSGIVVSAIKYCHRLSIVLKDELYDEFITSKDDNIRASVILYSDRVFPWLSTEEIREFLTDHSPKVRKAVIKRLKDQLTLDELHSLVEDPSVSVRNEAMKLIVEKSMDLDETIWIFNHPSSKKSTLKKALKKIAIISKNHLLDLLEAERREDVKGLIIEALKDFPCWRLKEALAKYLDDERDEIISKAIYSMSFACKGDEEVFKKVESFLDHSSPMVRKEALKALRRISREQIDVNKVLKMLDDVNPDVSKEALKTLSLLKIKEIERHVALFLTSKDDGMRKIALIAIRRLKLRDFENVLLNLIKSDEKLDIKKATFKALHSIKSQSLEEIVRQFLLLPEIDFELKYLAAKMAVKDFPMLVSQV
jgi:HEAT repeat protein